MRNQSSQDTIPSPVERPIIFFDGVCGVCNAFVDIMLRIDKRQVFLFAPIQGETARKHLPPLGENPGEWSIVLLDGAGLLARSDACMAIARRLGGVWRVVAWLRFMPRVLRDGTYRVIARNRYRWFGKRETCRVPTAEERARFLP
jgi:predicted DCC family thiol-disulfide oxidoreductase YuxK